MRILLSALRFVPGHTYGAEVYFGSLLKELATVLDSNDEIAFSGSKDACAWAEGVAPSIEILPRNIPRTVPAAMFYEKIMGQRFAEAWKADVVFFPFNIMPSMRTPSVLMLHDLVSHFYCKNYPNYKRLHNRFVSWLVNRSIQHADAVVVPSKAIAGEIRVAFTDSKHVTPIPEAAVVRSHSLDYISVPSFNKEYVLLLTGDKLPHKSQHTALSALSKIQEMDSVLYERMIMVVTGGNDKELNELRVLGMQLGIMDHLRFLGKVREQDLERLLNQGVLHLFPTLYEGFGLGVIEAQSRGKVVVASRIPVLEEVSGGIGAFFKPGDHVGMAIEIRKLLHNKMMRNQLEQDGLRHASQWSWNDHAMELLKLLRRVASK